MHSDREKKKTRNQFPFQLVAQLGFEIYRNANISSDE